MSSLYEIETKYKVDDFLEIKRRLHVIGAKKIKSVHEKDIYYQHPCRDFMNTDEALRIRIENDKNFFLTYKGPRVSFYPKKRIEINLVFDNLNNLRKLLKVLGFKEVVVIEKDREYWDLQPWKITLDNVKDLGYYIELEYQGDRYEKKLFDHMIKKIGLDEKKYIRESYLEMYLAKKKYNFA